MTTFDWDAVKRSVASAFEHTRDAAAANRIFQERARALAQRTLEVRTGRGSQHLLFDLGKVRFAVPFSDVRSITPLTWVTRIPGAPQYKCRVTHIAGRIVSLIDLNLLLELGAQDGEVREDRCLLLEHAGSYLGLLVSNLAGIEDLDTTGLSPAAQSARGDFVKGIAKGFVLVLDGKRVVARLRDESAGTQ
jgi:chemotaxis signal transduction protein